MEEYSEQDFLEWEADMSELGELEEKYRGYVEEFVQDEYPMREMMSYMEFARAEYEKFLLEVHEGDELDEDDMVFLNDDTEDDR